MQQFEELWEAAANLGVASRPLPLFYAISQAGRAISAAFNPDSKFQLHGHGIRWQKANDGKHLLESRIDVIPGAFSTVANVSGSAVADGPLCMGNLWYSLPELAGIYATGTDIPAPRALPVILVRRSSGMVIVYDTKVSADIHWLPEWLGSSSTIEDDLKSILASYPLADGWEIPKDGLRVGPSGNDSCSVRLSWVADGGNESDRQRRLDEIAPPYFRRDRRWLRPAAQQKSGAPVTMSPLMTWWALLYGFSINARYEPDVWTRLLRVDESPYAVPLESALASGVQSVPRLVLEALTSTAIFPGDWD